MAGILTNADFRSLITGSTNAPSSDVHEVSEKKIKKALKNNIVPEDEAKKERRKLRFLQYQKKKQMSSAKPIEDDPAAAKYRDRAEERRKGKDQLYRQVADELQEMKGRSIDESKYLGGDIEHTHLVKGLDFALLSKVQSKLSEASKLKTAEEAKLALEQAKKKSKEFKTQCGQKIYKYLFEDIHPHHLTFHKKLRHIDYTISRGARFKGNGDYFWPGRTSYIFDTRFDETGDEVPTIQFNSKENCRAPKDGVVVVLRPKLYDELAKALQWHTQNKKRKRGERLPRRPLERYPQAFEKSSDFPLRPENLISGIGGKHASDDGEDIYKEIGAFDAEQLASNMGSGNLANISEEGGHEGKNRVGYGGSAKPSYFEEPLESRRMPHSAQASEALKINAFASDIIRDEQGMDVDDDENAASRNVSFGSYQPVYAFPAGIDPRSSMASVYGMGVCDDMVAPHAEIPGGFVNLGSENQLEAPQDSSEAAYLHSSKRFKSGMTTWDQDKGLHSVYKRDDNVFKKRGNEDEREKDPAFISDTYTECYPGFGAEVSFEAYDSDDEEDRSKMDMGRQKQYGAKRRDDFKRKEDWEQYQLKKEALPKAAFQYGKKMDDNRVTRRKKKMNPDEEWKKIEKMLGDGSSRFSGPPDDGFDYEG